METMRAFIAVDIPDALRDELARLQQRIASRLPGGIRWVSPGHIHVTLKFLGSIPAARVAALSTALEEVTVTSCALAVGGLGAFPSSRGAKVLWAGVDGGGDLAALYAQVAAALARIGIAPEQRPFAPHLTLGRVRDHRIRRELAPLIDEHGRDRLGRYPAEAVRLYRSDLSPAGPHYTVLTEIPLAQSP